MHAVTKFVFDASNACDTVIPNYDHGEECLVVKAALNPRVAVALVLYAALAVLAGRLCVSELHGDFGHGASTIARPSSPFRLSAQ